MYFSCMKSSHRILNYNNKKKHKINQCEKYHHETLHNDKYEKKIEKTNKAYSDILI